MILLACLGLPLLPPAAAQSGGSAAGFSQPPAQLWPPLSPGQATVSTAEQLLQALEQNVGEIILQDDIKLTAQDWSKFELPILIQSNGTTVWVHSADDSGIGVRPRTLDWGGAMNLLQVDPGATLAFEDLVSSHPGNFTAGEEVMQLKNNGSFVWPTIVQLEGSSVSTAAAAKHGSSRAW
jgi:hypothetical protein